MTVYWYRCQERAMAPGIADGWPKIIPAPHTPNGRLVRVEGDPDKEITQLRAHLAAQLAESRAECERLREALERVRPVIHYYDPEQTGIKVNRVPRFNGLCRIIDQALTPKETTDE